MQHFSFYRSVDGDDNVCRPDVPLQVNCCGTVAQSHPFSTVSQSGRHDFYLLCMAEGSMTCRTSSGDRLISPGDFIIYPPETPYGYTFSGDSMGYYWVHFTGSLAAGLIESCALPLNRVTRSALDAGVTDALQALHSLFIRRGACFDAECAAQLTLLLARLRRGMDASAMDVPTGTPLQTSLEYLHRHYAQPLTVPALAAMEFLSPSRYSALFRARTGLSPQQYLIRLRMRTAMELLRGTDMPVREIARSVGYDDQLYFSRLFRKFSGQTPSACRADARQSGA